MILKNLSFAPKSCLVKPVTVSKIVALLGRNVAHVVTGMLEDVLNTCVLNLVLYPVKARFREDRFPPVSVSPAVRQNSGKTGNIFF